MVAKCRTPIIVSACLAGMGTRYDGGSCECPRVLRKLSSDVIIPVCPEQLGGLPTPRQPAEIIGGDGRSVMRGEAQVVRDDGTNVTSQYIQGAVEVMRVVRLNEVSTAYLKEGSPSCGVKRIKRCGADVTGCGVTTAILEREGVQVEGFA